MENQLVRNEVMEEKDYIKAREIISSFYFLYLYIIFNTHIINERSVN